MASVNFDMVAADSMLKTIYDAPGVMQDLSYSDRPFFALVTKSGGMGGQGVKIPLSIGTSAGYAPTVAQAQAILASQTLEAFLVTPIVLLSVARISGLTLEASLTSKEAFAKGAKLVIDSAIKKLSNSVSSALFRDGSGVIGSIGSEGSGVITLADPASVVQFEVNQALQAVVSGVLQAATAYVVAVNRNLGTISISSALGGTAATVTGFTAVGANLIGYGTLNLVTKGLSAWLTDSALSTPFFGVDRSIDSERLAGILYDGSALSVKDALVNAINRVAREGGTPDYVICNYETYTQLSQDLNSNVIYTSLEGDGKVSFSGFKFNGPKGPVTVLADRDCPSNTAFLLQMDTWLLLHVNSGEPIFIDDNNGKGMWRTVESYDGYEVRVKHYGQLACTAPGWNAKVTTSA
jgi:hypothetical protein